MIPKNLRFGGGLSETVLHPFTAVAMLIAIALILALPRKKMIVPFVVAFFTIPVGQVLVVAGVHFTMLQILILTVLGKMAAFHETKTEKKFSGGLNGIDKITMLWSLSALVIFSLQFLDIQAVIKGLGDLVVTLGGYVAMRFLIPDKETMQRGIKALAVVCVIQGICMMSEQYTYRNVFDFAGANEPTIREGHVRSEGALGTLYSGPIAGTAIPFFLWLWTDKKSRMWTLAGVAGATAIVYASHASTSWMAYGASLFGLGFWPLRKNMKWVRWGLVGILVALHLAMKGPVWSLMTKIDLTGGSSSYHRYYLVDNCIRHFWDWWLLGCRNYGDWGYDMWDLCNQFVVNALTGGLITLILYITIFKRTFRAIGLARKRVAGDGKREWLFWCLGSSLFGNVVAHFGINYMVHLITYFFFLLVCVSAATADLKRATKPRVAVPSEPSVAPLPDLVNA